MKRRSQHLIKCADGLKNPTDEKYSEAFFDSITSSEYTLNFSSSDFTETASDKGDAVIVECNGLSYGTCSGQEKNGRK